MKNLSIIILIFIALSCSKKKDETPFPVGSTGNVNISFDNVVGDYDLTLNSEKYLNAHGDTFSVSLFKYYISNVKLRRITDQVWVNLPASNNLIEEGVKNNFTISNVAMATYDLIEFKVGLDSATNFGSNFNEDLNKSKGMYWDWDPQYVFLKFEGKHFYNSTNSALVFHVAENLNLKTIQLPINSSVLNNTLNLSIKADLLKLFESPNLIDFNIINNVVGGVNVSKIASNYSGMFSVIN